MSSYHFTLTRLASISISGCPSSIVHRVKDKSNSAFSFTITKLNGGRDGRQINKGERHCNIHKTQQARALRTLVTSLNRNFHSVILLCFWNPERQDAIR